ncbi:MAG: hypothetical protein H4O13_02165 [Xanthomonadales bacterium]|nr:hypothetical protein [Xanthomonadales bacterium]
MRLILPTFLLLFAGIAQAAPIENKWRLQFSGNAESSGSLVLAFTPKDGAATEVEVTIEDGTSENGVARRVREALREAIGEDYRVEVDDGEDVLVKRRLGRPRFNVSLVNNSVEGVRLNLDQE